MRLINIRPSRPFALALALIPFLVVIALYSYASSVRLADNPRDRLTPALSTIAERIASLPVAEDRRSGEINFWVDTAASLERLASGVAIAAAIGLAAGLAIGLLPGVRATFASFVNVVSLIPPMALLPILFIVFGLGDDGKIALIAIGITPFLIRDLAARTLELPREQIVKAQTLGASSWTLATRVALPQIMPRLIQSVRLSLGPAWLFLIAAEMISAESGLGYRIFLMRRSLAMDVILPYVLWITLLAFLIDQVLRLLSKAAYPWAHLEGDGL